MKTTAWLLMGIMGISMVGGASAAWAAPERMQIKEEGRRVKEDTAKAHLKNINLNNIEDPEARKAIAEILSYLNLKAGR